MKILQLIDSLDTGGAERMAVNIANALTQDIETSMLCATRKGGDLEKSILQEVHYEILQKKSILDFKAIRSFFFIVKQYKVDIIHAHSTSLFLAVLTKFRYPKLQIVWHNHYGNSPTIKGVRLLAYKLLSHFVAISIALNEELLNWSKTHLKADQHVILNNFVKIDSNENLISPLSGVFGKRVLCLANLRVEKNHLFLIKSFEKAIHNFPEWTLHLVGSDSNDDYSNTVYNYITQNRLENNVFVYGCRSDVSAILSHCDIGVLVSKFEAEPLSLIEYGFAGLPVIVTNVGKCATIVGDTGIVINQSEDQLQKALVRLFESKEYRTSLGIRFCESVQKKYSQERTMAKLCSFYSSLIP